MTIEGRIVDEKLTSLSGLIIINLNNRVNSMSDMNGCYKITAKENDTLKFRMVGLTSEIKIIERNNQTLNLIMIDKDINCLGAIWSKRKYRIENRKIEKKLKKLYKRAKKQKIWDRCYC